jgi:hypothetical protein
LLCFPLMLSAQKSNTGKKNIFITPLFESLYSTHGNFFYSGSLTVSATISKRIEIGLGVEKAFTPVHHDNGFVLSQLQFSPLHGNVKYHFKSCGKFSPFVETSAGVSFNKYRKASDDNPSNKYLVKETGIFLYTGGGLRYAVSNKILLVSGVGLKGYKMSFNVYDVNPHGVSYWACVLN